MKRLLIFLLIVMSIAAVTVPVYQSSANPWSGNFKDGRPLKIIYIGDVHRGNPVGGQWKGAVRLGKIVDWSNTHGIDAWIVGGDWQWDQNSLGSTDAMRDTVLQVFQHDLKCPVYPCVGNHEWNAADTSSGALYNDFTNHWGGFFSPWTGNADSQRGNRWYATRIMNRNVVLIVEQNNRDVSSGTANYFENNPKDGSGVLPYDFDGISDSTSTQRKDLKWAVQNFLEPDDWLIHCAHRSVDPLAWVSARPQQEGAHTDANQSQSMWLDANMDRHWINLDNDVHEVKCIGPYGKHYTFSACMAPRSYAQDMRYFTPMAPYIQMFALYDTVWSARNLGLVDSLGYQGQLNATQPPGNTLNDHRNWNVFWEFEFVGRQCTARAWLMQYENDAVTVVDSLVIYQKG